MKKLFIFTDGFPYGKGEKSFITNELLELSKHYETTVMSCARASILNNNDFTTNLEKNIKVVKVYKYKFHPLKLVYLICVIFSKQFIEEIIRIFKTKSQIFGRIMDSLKFYLNSRMDLFQFNKAGILKDVNDSIYYTFWNNDVALAISLAKEQNPNLKFISRIHGYDLYNDRAKHGLQPFKSYMDTKVDKVIFAAQYAMDYYLDTLVNCKNSNKYCLSRIGIQDQYVNIDKQDDSFILVSCSNINKIKRINLIINVLDSLPERIKVSWIHFGDGEEKGKIVEYARTKLGKNENINYNFYGSINNADLIQWYKKNYVDCFITMTSSEGGCPVSISEALMFGIPVIAPNVCSLYESVENNGFLVDNDEDIVKNATNYLLEMIDADKYKIKQMRENSRKVFNEKFEFSNNFNELFSRIFKKLNN